MVLIWIAYIGSYKMKKSFAPEKNEWLGICNVQSEIKW
jgi:hypothetical protein